ncbi:unnamed protein product, partial [Phaeothamnion confervicola]
MTGRSESRRGRPCGIPTSERSVRPTCDVLRPPRLRSGPPAIRRRRGARLTAHHGNPGQQYKDASWRRHGQRGHGRRRRRRGFEVRPRRRYAAAPAAGAAGEGRQREKEGPTGVRWLFRRRHGR